MMASGVVGVSLKCNTSRVHASPKGQGPAPQVFVTLTMIFLSDCDALKINIVMAGYGVELAIIYLLYNFLNSYDKKTHGNSGRRPQTRQFSYWTVGN